MKIYFDEIGLHTSTPCKYYLWDNQLMERNLELLGPFEYVILDDNFFISSYVEPSFITDYHTVWYRSGKAHRLGGPAWVRDDGQCKYYIYNELLNPSDYWDKMNHYMEYLFDLLFMESSNER